MSKCQAVSLEFIERHRPPNGYGARILTTDGSYESEKVKGKKRDKDNAKPGTVVVVIPPAGKPRWLKLKDELKIVPNPPEKV